MRLMRVRGEDGVAVAVEALGGPGGVPTAPPGLG